MRINKPNSKIVKIDRPDIVIDNAGGLGFFTIWGETRRGIAWLQTNVQGAEHDPAGAACCDDRGFAWDIYQGALADGLKVAA